MQTRSSRSVPPVLERQSACRTIVFNVKGRRRARILGMPENDTYQYHFTTDRNGRRHHHLVSMDTDLFMFTLPSDPSGMFTFLD